MTQYKHGDNTSMTVDDALHSGYQIGDSTYQRGYVSRKINVMQQPVQVAGGSRAGELYFDGPCYHSTRYHYRTYLIPTHREVDE